jgi:quinol monooxygenase YgiN
VSEVIVVATVRAKPGAESQLESEFMELIPKVHAEDGCLLYALHRSASDPTELVVIERWSSQAALDQHMTQPALQGFGERAGELFAEPPAISFYEALPAGREELGAL